MSRLWVRLSLAFGSLILIVIAVIALAPPLVIWRMTPDPRDAPSVPSYTTLADALVRYYGTHGGWASVNILLDGAHASLPPFQSRVVFSDARGGLLYDAGAMDPASPTEKPALSAEEQKWAIRIEAGSQVVGYLTLRTVSPPPPLPPNAQEFLLQQLLRFLFYAAIIGGPLAILVAVLLSRGMTRPLGRLAEAARTIATGEFGLRVEPTGSAETVEVAVAFNEMTAALQRAETLRRNMIADAAHALRTPLSVLQANLRALLDDVYALDKTEVAALYNQTWHLRRLVDDLHELALADAGQLSLDLASINVAALISDAVAVFAAVAEEQGVQLRVDLAPDLSPTTGDAARLTQVLHELITNALQHTPSGGQITLSAAREPRAGGEEWLVLTVRDSGQGVRPEHLANLFERFYRADSGRRRDAGGSGLGLAIARAIVKMHGGTLGVTSAGLPGHGTTFTIRLPV
jgi:signal transduction histidine kinase